MMNIEDEKRATADKFIQAAEIAYSKGDLEKAERLLVKAERTCPTILAKQMLEDVKAAKNRNNKVVSENTEQENDVNTESVQYKYCRTEMDQRHAETCIVIAKLAISKGDFDKAQRFIMKSQRLYPSDEINTLLEQLKDMKKKFSGSGYCAKFTFGSKEDAEKCIEVAQDEFAAGNLARAERILEKSERLFPTSRAKDLLQQIKEKRADGCVDEDGPRNSENHKPRISVREVKQERPKRTEPTQEQIDAIQRVQAATDDYEIFGVEKQCPVKDVKTSYRHLAALLHPDKNKAPGAKEAFMTMREALDRIKKNHNTKKW